MNLLKLPLVTSFINDFAKSSMKDELTIQMLLLCLLPLVSSYNFLIYSPMLGHSHVNFMGTIADTLTEAGHNVTVLMPVAERRMENRTGSKTTTDIIQLKMSDELDGNVKEFLRVMKAQTWLEKVDPMAMMGMSAVRLKVFENMCRDTLEHDDVIEALRAKYFDVGISQPMMACGLGIFEHLNIPATIVASSLTPLDVVSKLIGQPLAPSYVPGTMSVGSTDIMSMWERAKNLFQANMANGMFDKVFDVEHEVFKRKYGADFKSPQELISQMSFQFINTNPLLDFPFPTTQKNVAIAGIQVKTANMEKLDEKWDKILNKRSRNVLISFGSVAHSAEMPQQYKTSLLELFASMPDTTFIWKYEEEGSTLTSHLENVHLSTWMPQNAFLGDRRLSVFITHGGLGSTTEIAHLGKPALMIPLFGDQSRNAAMLSRHGGAKVLEKFDLANPQKIKEAIEEMIDNKNYSSNALRLSEMLRQQPFSARELVVKYSEFVAKFGRLPQLDPYGRHLSFVQYFYLDVLSLLALSCFVVIFIIWRALSYCYRRCMKAKID